MSELNRAVLMEVYPSVLNRDELFNALGQTAAEALGAAFLGVKRAGIYNQIAELDEEVLDILAKDFNISWYDYNFQPETKRRVIAAAFSVQRNLGTRGSIEKALSAIWPPSSVEEWFEYGGDPFYFRAIIEASDQGYEPISTDTLLRTINLYKNERSWLEDDAIIIRVTFSIVVNTDSQSRKYHTPVSGTLPRWASHGSMSHENITVETDSEDHVYHVRRLSGDDRAGEQPRWSSHGNVGNNGLSVDVSVSGTAYRVKPCGTPLNSLM